MAEWKKIITSGSNAELNHITSSGEISVASITGVTSLTAGGDLDIGAHEFRAETFESDVSTGTAPFTIASTTAVSNLNADLLDGQHGSHYLDFGNFVIDNDEIPIAKLAEDAITIAGTSTQLGGSITSAAILNNGKAIVSGSLGPNATLIRSLTAANISGSFTDLSSSLASRVTTAEGFTGDVTSVTAGTGMTGVNESGGDVTLNVVGGTGITANANDVAITAAQTGITSIIKSDFTKLGTATDQEYIDFGTTDEVSIGVDDTKRLTVNTTGVVVTGNLTVNGTTTTVNTTNTLAADRFMLLNSGSSSGDGGIIVQTEGTASGSAFVYNDDQSRWGVQQGTKLAQDATTAGAVDGHVSVAVTSDVAAHRKNGNIRVESDEIYIYVE